MPLLDHFQPPLAPVRAWESFYAYWSAAIGERLNRVVLPEGYFADIQVHVGGRVEVDVASLQHLEFATVVEQAGGGVAVATWAPPKVALSMPAVFPDEFEVLGFRSSGWAILVGAVELISPRNKDRPATRRAFAAKCASYLQRGIGLVIVDIVTERQANLHDELVQLLDQPEQFRFPRSAPLYTVAYRPIRRDPEGDQIDIWPTPLGVGQELPTIPLALRGGPISRWSWKSPTPRLDSAAACRGKGLSMIWEGSSQRAPHPSVRRRRKLRVDIIFRSEDETPATCLHSSQIAQQASEIRNVAPPTPPASVGN